MFVHYLPNIASANDMSTTCFAEVGCGMCQCDLSNSKVGAVKSFKLYIASNQMEIVDHGALNRAVVSRMLYLILCSLKVNCGT